jgi:dual specificity phosphatase 12
MSDELLGVVIITIIVLILYTRYKQDRNHMSLIWPQKIANQLGLEPGVYLSDWSTAVDEAALQNKRIRTIICLNERQKNREDLLMYERNQIVYSHYTLNDVPQAPIHLLFDKCYREIEEGLQRGNVLVHCTAGISRSSTIVLMWMMRRYGMSYREALEAARQSRPIVNPNPGFAAHLQGGG